MLSSSDLISLLRTWASNSSTPTALSCHGIDAKGKRGITDLVTGVFNNGSDEDGVRTTITHGRQGAMPAMGGQYGEMDLGQLVAYVQSLSSDEPMSRSAERGERLFAADCSVCHGVGGVGIRELGAPEPGG